MEFDLLFRLPRTNCFENFLEAYNNNGKVIIFGAGDQGLLTAALLQENGIAVWRFCDNNPQLIDKNVKGIKTIMPDQLSSVDGDYLIINNDSYRQSKKEQLLAMGVAENKIYTFDVLNPLFKELTREYVEKNKDKFKESYCFLEDDESRRVFFKYLEGVFTGNLDFYADIATGNDYFPLFITPQRKDHVFLDVGAYDGNTIESFQSYFPQYEKIYAFEPFEESANKIKEKNFANTEVVLAAASDYSGKKDFYCNDYGNLTMVTTILEKGANHKKITLNTVAIDDVVQDGKVTFVKMDIEGSELEALHGAAETIRNNKPFLAICAYHKKEDLITLIPYVKKLVPEYKVYLRHHSKTPSDLVIYCTID